MTVEWTKALSKHWSLLAIGEGSRFSDRIRQSPIVKDDVNGQVAVGVTYRF